MNEKLRIVINEIRVEIRRAERLHLTLYGEQVWAVDHFDAWAQDHFSRMKATIVEWAGGENGYIQHLRDEVVNDAQMIQALALLDAQLATASITQNNFYPALP